MTISDLAVAMHHLAGIPGAAPLLVAHATGFHGRCYQPMAAHLAVRFDVWALDFGGHGATPAPTDEPVDWRGYGRQALDAARWLGERSGRPVAAFGHSMGGATLTMAAIAEPDRFEALVLYEPVLFPPDPARTGPNPLAEGAARRRREFASVEAAYANFANKPPMAAFDPAALRAYVEGGLTPLDAGDPEGPVRLCCTPEHESATFAAASADPVWDELVGLRLPVTVAAGTTATDDLPAVVAPQVAAQIPSGRYEFHPELDHFAPLVAPAAVAAIVAHALPPHP